MIYCLQILAVALCLYLALAAGVNLIARFAPVPRKPLLNAALLGAVVVCYLVAVAVLAASP